MPYLYCNKTSLTIKHFVVSLKGGGCSLILTVNCSLLEFMWYKQCLCDFCTCTVALWQHLGLKH